MANKSTAFFERGSWYHRVKTLNEDGTVKYGKKGGFLSEQEAVKAYKQSEKEFKQKQRKQLMEGNNRHEIMLTDYLEYWYEEVFSQRVENTTRMLSAYVLYKLVFPNIEQDIKLRFVSVEYMDALLEKISHSCESAGNTSRTYLNIAFKDALIEGYISRNPIPDILFEAILEERERYVRNRKRRMNDIKNPFMDADYICCSSYGKPRSRDFHWNYYKQLLKDNNLPDIRWHDLRATYCTILLKNDFNPKAVSKLMGHAKEIITIDVYGDNQELIADCLEELEPFIQEVLPKEEENFDLTEMNYMDRVAEELLGGCPE